MQSGDEHRHQVEAQRHLVEAQGAGGVPSGLQASIDRTLGPLSEEVAATR